MGYGIKAVTWDFVFFTTCFTKLLLINSSTEPSLELPILSSSFPCFLQEEHENKVTNLLTFVLSLFLYYLWYRFVVILPCIYLILVVNSLGRNGASLNFTVFLELCIWSSAELIIVVIATARSTGLTSQNEKSQLLFFFFFNSSWLTSTACWGSLITESDYREFWTSKTYLPLSYEWAKGWFLKWETC